MTVYTGCLYQEIFHTFLIILLDINLLYLIFHNEYAKTMVKNIVFTKVVTGIVVPNIRYQIIILMLLSYLFKFDTEKKLCSSDL